MILQMALFYLETTKAIVIWMNGVSQGFAGTICKPLSQVNTEDPKKKKNAEVFPANRIGLVSAKVTYLRGWLVDWLAATTRTICVMFTNGNVCFPTNTPIQSAKAMQSKGQWRGASRRRREKHTHTQRRSQYLPLEGALAKHRSPPCSTEWNCWLGQHT